MAEERAGRHGEEGGQFRSELWKGKMPDRVDAAMHG
jgi:hypothetical protein